MEIAFLARRFVPSYREGGGDRIYSQPRESIRIPRTYLSFCRAVPHPPTVPRPRNYDATLWSGGRGVVRRGSCATSVKLDRETIVGLSYCSPFLPPYTRRKGVRAKNFVGETMKSNRNVACDISFFTSRFSEFDTLISSDINNDEE